MADEKQDLFKEEFKRYKRRSPAVDLSDVVDLRHPERFNGEVSQEVSVLMIYFSFVFDLACPSTPGVCGCRLPIRR